MWRADPVRQDVEASPRRRFAARRFRLVPAGRFRSAAAVIGLRMRSQRRGELAAGAASVVLTGPGEQDRPRRRPGREADGEEDAAGAGGRRVVPRGIIASAHHGGTPDRHGLLAEAARSTTRYGRRAVGAAQHAGVHVQPLITQGWPVGGCGEARMGFPVDQRFVTRTEDKLATKFSLSYVAQMCKENGGGVKAGEDHWSLYPILDDSDRKRLKRTCNDVIYETNQARKWPSFPAEAVAIGSNGGGDQLVFLHDAGAGRLGDAVYWWDHETGEVQKVAEDFLDLSKRSG